VAMYNHCRVEDDLYQQLCTAQMLLSN